ncbi:MAG: hypothetical protein KC543_05460 [Myxococcales bacterium]|nr:hypothetical protein [Myxococcales bacterium]
MGLSLVAALAGCASTSGATGEPTTSAATTPAAGTAAGGYARDGQAGRMARTCPMRVPGTTVVAADVDGGAALTFTTTEGDVAELRRRVRARADMHNKRMMKRQQCAADASSTQCQARRRDAAMAGREAMPPATASVEDVDHGARLVVRPKDPSQVDALRERVHMKAERMASGQCPMRSRRGAAPPPAN